MTGAIEDYAEAIRLAPEMDEAYNNRGTAHLASGDVDSALQDFAEAIRLNPAKGATYYNAATLSSRTATRLRR